MFLVPQPQVLSFLFIPFISTCHIQNVSQNSNHLVYRSSIHVITDITANNTTAFPPFSKIHRHPLYPSLSKTINDVLAEITANIVILPTVLAGVKYL